MTKIFFDYDKLNNTTLTNITASKNYLDKACKTSNYLDIPGDFKYKSTLKNITSRINDLDKEIRDIIEWLENSKTMYKELSLKTAEECSKLTISEIERRENFLK